MTGSARTAGWTALPPLLDTVLASPGRPLDPLAASPLQASLHDHLGDIGQPRGRGRPTAVEVSEARDPHERWAANVAGAVTSESRPDTARAYRRARTVDVSGIRVHTDEQAARSARLLGADAYTFGRDIVFGRGRYEPGSEAGRRLLAHELVHALAPAGGRPVLWRQEAAGTDPATAFNDALSRGAWPEAARALTEMGHDDRMAELAALSPDARYQLRSAAQALDPSPANPVTADIDATETAPPTPAASKAAQPASPPQAGTGPTQADNRVLLMSDSEKLWEAAKLSLPYLTGEVLEQLIGAIGFLAVSHTFGLGELLDAAGLLFLGKAALDALGLVLDYYWQATHARTEADLRAAGEKLAKALGIITVSAIMWMAGAAAKKGGSKPAGPGLKPGLGPGSGSGAGPDLEPGGGSSPETGPGAGDGPGAEPPTGREPAPESAPGPAPTPAQRLASLEARIEALEGTNAPAGDLIKQFDDVDPHDLAQIQALEDRVKFWEGEELGPAPKDLGEETEESEAARRAAQGKWAEQIEANRTQGTEGELGVEDEVLSGKTIPELGEPAKLVDTQVRIKTSAGLRKVDLLVELPTGEKVALEVKTGGASRSEYQQECDTALEMQGGRVTGSQRGNVQKGPIGPIRTVVVQR